MGKPRASVSDSPSTGGLVILGLLLDGPRSGYEIVQIIERSIGQFWPMTKAHVYAELPRLADAGFARGERVAQQGAPDKVVYSATAAGRDTFRAWIATADLGAPRLHHPLLLKLFFAAEMSHESVRGLVDQREEEIRRTLAKYGELLSASRKIGPSPRQWTLRYGVLRLEAELAFLDEVRNQLRKARKAAIRPRPTRKRAR